MSKLWIKTALGNLLIAACMGAILRYAFVEEVSWLHFRYFLHGHSHVAMLGWVGLALYIYLLHAFLPEEQQKAGAFRQVFIVSQAAVAGMLVTFPIMGYQFWSIAFSALYMLTAYFFTFHFLRLIKALGMEGRWSVRFVRTALYLMVFSTLAWWAMGPIVALGWQGSSLYFANVQFFLHFQFNGWFVFAVVGLFFRLLEWKGIDLPDKEVKIFFILLLISCLLTFALAIAWSSPHPAIFLVNSLGVGCQLIALIFLLRILLHIRPQAEPSIRGWQRWLLGVTLACFLLKLLIQTAVVIPYIATVAYTIRNYVIGFFHLFLLGAVTTFLFGFGLQRGILRLSGKLGKWGLGLFLAGFLGSECILFLQGTMFWAAMGFLPCYYEGLFGVSALMPAGVFLFWIAQMKGGRSSGGMNQPG